MCKDVVLANMSWLQLEDKKAQLAAWFDVAGHNFEHPDFSANSKMYSEICTEIYKRKLEIELHEC